MYIEPEIIDALQIENYTVAERFCSRKNEVYRVSACRIDGTQTDFVYKRYVLGDMDKEYASLSRLNGGHVPVVIAKGQSALGLEYIAGQTLYEVLEKSERDPTSFDAYADALVEFLCGFYAELSGYTYGDVNLRNFIVAEQGLYGVDLEDVMPGEKAADVGKIAAYMLTYDPAYTQYKRNAEAYFVDRCVDRLHLSRAAVFFEKEKELERMRVRRAERKDDKHAEENKNK